MRMTCKFAVSLVVKLAISLAAAALASSVAAAQQSYHDVFATSDHCIACHSDIVDDRGEDVSIGTRWRATMMANSARDPYWHAAVRRETLDHPAAADAIEDKCSTCHMPMARFAAHAAGGEGEVLDHVAALLAPGRAGTATSAQSLAVDGVSCTVCHQIRSDNFGDESSFDGGFVIDVSGPAEGRPLYGPYDVDAGRAQVMRSSSAYEPTPSETLRSSELCATCHTLFTNALDDRGAPAGVLPEQMPYPEWLHSDYAASRSCQSCHMPAVEGAAPITAILGPPREGVLQHAFLGGNAFVLGILKDHADALDVTATADELEAAIAATERHLAEETARIRIADARVAGGQVRFAVDVESLSGHKLPTAYPSRRVWLHVTVRDADGTVVFESGAVGPDGAIAGNANDADPAAFEPHYTEITAPDQVQIYEPILGDHAGRVTTGLINGVAYLKDNRILPAGFDKTTAPEEVAVRGAALDDADFVGGSDRVRYRVDVGGGQGGGAQAGGANAGGAHAGGAQARGAQAPFRIEAELLYEAIGYRWAQNLRPYAEAAPEPARFLDYYAAAAHGSAKRVARAEAEAR